LDGCVLTMAVMVPLAFIVLAPLSNLMGGALSMALYGIAGTGGVGYLAAMLLVGGLWQLLVITGMHIAIIMPALVSFMQMGEDSFIFVATNVAMFGVWGMILGAALRMRNKDERALSFGYLVSAVLGGVTEPALFGILMRFRRTIPCVIVASGAGSLLAGILGLTLYMPGAMSNFLFFIGYLSGGTANLVKLIVCAGISFVLGAVLTYLFGISKEELAEMDSESSVGALA
jgi:PTS system beta-glucosides-specific IIC component